MTSNKDIAFNVINQEFEKMSNLVLEQLGILESILQEDEKSRTKDHFKKLKANEVEIDNLEIILDNKIIQTIVLYKPVASDLRHIFSLYRMMVNLERIGDLIIKIYHFNKDIEDKYFIKKSSQALQHMLSSVTYMVRNALLSFFNNNPDEALKTIEQDAEINKINKKLLDKTLSRLNVSQDEREMVANFVDIKSMISAVERIGDQATNIAEASIYAITGTNIAHQDIKKL